MIKLDKILAINMEKTGQKIKALREEKGLTVKDLQTACGFRTPAAVYKWESGVSLPSIDNLVILGHVFSKSINEILVLYDT